VNQNYIEIPSHPNWNCYHQENKQQQMLARMQGEKNTYTLLMGLKIGAITVEISMEVLQKSKKAPTI
jgi:hypothetical protein